MFVMANRDPAFMKPGEEEILESVVRDMSAELGESVVARGVRSLEYSVYHDEQGRHVMFEFHNVGAPQVSVKEFERVLAMRFVQVLWEKYRKRCLPVGLPQEDLKFVTWPEGPIDFVLGREGKSEREDALPPGLSQEDRPPVRAGRNDPCPCGSGRKFKNCCMRR